VMAAADVKRSIATSANVLTEKIGLRGLVELGTEIFDIGCTS
jgi:hypothetical protein